jgi:hypothetical protein
MPGLSARATSCSPRSRSPVQNPGALSAHLRLAARSRTYAPRSSSSDTSSRLRDLGAREPARPELGDAERDLELRPLVVYQRAVQGAEERMLRPSQGPASICPHGARPDADVLAHPVHALPGRALGGLVVAGGRVRQPGTAAVAADSQELRAVRPERQQVVRELDGHRAEALERERATQPLMPDLLGCREHGPSRPRRGRPRAWADAQAVPQLVDQRENVRMVE